MNRVTNEMPQYADALGFIAPQMQEPWADLRFTDNLDLVHVTAAPPFATSTGQTLGEISHFKEVVGAQRELQVVTDGAELQTVLKTPDKVAVVLGLQHTPEDVLEGDNLAKLYMAGVRVMTPAYRSATRFGSGYGDANGDLQPDGAKLLDRMSGYPGMILDIAHLNQPTADDAMRYVAENYLSLPVMYSHGGVRDYFDGSGNSVNNLRNLPLDSLRRLRDLGGVAGMYQLTFGLSDTDNSPGAFAHQVFLASEALPGAVVIGSDGTYAERSEAEWEETFRLLNSKVGSDLVPRHPDTPFELNGVDRMQRVEDLLVAEGVSRDETTQIVGKRLVEFFLRSL